MKEIAKNYNPREFEEKIYDMWLKNDCFRAEAGSDKKPFTIVIPPPNVTGKLHEGHALNHTMQDILIRYKRLRGYETLWLPGTDHASIATEVKVLEKIKKETGKTKEDLTREEFLVEAWDWKHKHGNKITEQMKKLGDSCDWSRERFTMDEGFSDAVTEVFVRLYHEGLIYKGTRIVNWCCDCKTTLSDAEVDYSDKEGAFYNVKYYLEDSDEYLIVATTRPETIPGDTGIAVNPEDERYKHLIGKNAIHPLNGRKLEIVGDSYVDLKLGTGVLKVTPAHDMNDYEIGKRHSLEIVNVFNKDGSLNELSGKYNGLDRYEARKVITEDLKNMGNLLEVKPYLHSVGECYRCSTEIEPRVSEQWFVKMEEMGKSAYDSVKEGNMKFVPEHFVKIYNNWLENIHDWCISRQLWWGHRIPAYTCDECGKLTVDKETPTKCSCGSTKLTQDPDVVDTWFSSALWPFATLGWPEKTEDLDFFYPTDVLVTGYDIIFFWVVRMMFSGLKHMGKEPFSTTLINGLVRDRHGRKVSKSLNNGTDPIDIIEKYGADALRFMLISGNSIGNDTRFLMEKIEAARNFANKLHNATRFILLSLDGDIGDIDENTNLDISDKWILSELNKQIENTGNLLDRFELGVAADEIVSFVWGDYCDWFIELSKSKLYSDNEKEKEDKLKVLLYVLKDILRLLHPFMPFITEELWQSLPVTNTFLVNDTWPEVNKLSSGEQKEMKLIMEAIKAVRKIRKDMDIPGSKKGRLFVQEGSDFTNSFVKNSSYFRNLCSVSEIEVVSSETDNSSVIVLDGMKLYFPLDEYINYEKELERLLKEEKRLLSEIDRGNKKLSNKGFVEKAPKSLIDKEREKLEVYKKQYEELKISLEDTRKKLK